MKALKLARMMESMGYKVFLYGSEDFDINKKSSIEPITCINKEKQHEFFGDNDHTKKFYNITWGINDLCWLHFNHNAIQEIKKRIKPKDLILTFAGLCQKQIADAFPQHMTVEAGIGYTGVFSKYKVFESNAWMHFIHGRQDNDDGDFYETVIPNYYDPDEFPLGEQGDYFLFVGRLIDRKGYRIAQEVCEYIGAKLILAGQMDGEFSGYGEHVGTVDAKKRGQLMSNAIAVFTPTTYLGPFEGVHAEALLCGTPVITTPFGVYTETVVNGFNGKRCYTFKDFVNAALWAQTLNQRSRNSIQIAARKKWTFDVVSKQYDEYFMRLMDLYNSGWYEM